MTARLMAVLLVVVVLLTGSVTTGGAAHSVDAPSTVDAPNQGWIDGPDTSSTSDSRTTGSRDRSVRAVEVTGLPQEISTTPLPDGTASPDGPASPDATAPRDGNASPNATAPRDGTASPDATAPRDGNASPAIVSAYPNPVTPGDTGEYVEIRIPDAANPGTLTLTDGTTTVQLPNASIGTNSETETVLVSSSPDAAREHYSNATASTHPTAALTVVESSSLALANSRDTLRLRNGSGHVVSTLTYENAPEGETYRNGSFNPLGATNHPVRTTADVDAQAFVLPDTPIPLDAVRNADERVYLAGYTFASERTARVLERTAARGVDVRVLVDDAPVGGITRQQLTILNQLAASNVTVRALGGPRGRYDFQHAKYVVADDTAIVLTENWKPSGTGGRANRGWGVVLDDEAVATDLATVFAADWRAHDAIAWSTAAADVTVDPEQPATDRYPERTPPQNVTVDTVTVATSPDNAERVLRSRLRNATDRVHVIQMTAARDGVLLEAAIAAARRGVDVRILLSSAWYAREANGRVVDALNALAAKEDLQLDARLVDPDGRFRKVHVKGVVIDDAVVLGSINWNDHSLRENREIAVVLEGDDVAAYYATAFDADWTATTSNTIPTWLAVTGVIAGLVLLGVLARKIEFR